MSHNVLVTGAGKAVGLGFNLVISYLEAGSTVCATIRKPCKELDELKQQYADRLIILTMDISSTESVQAPALDLTGVLQLRNDRSKTVYSIALSETQFMSFNAKHKGSPGTMTALLLSCLDHRDAGKYGDRSAAP